MSDRKATCRTFKYRIYPNRREASALEAMLREAARLYNAALQERRDAWKICRHRVTFLDQSRQLTEIRAAGDIGIANVAIARDVLRRVDDAFIAFFRRVKSGHKGGYPRFRSAARYHTIRTRQADFGIYILSGRVYVQGVGSIRANWHREPVGTVRSASVTRKAGRWYACFACEASGEPLPDKQATVGIDVGLTSFVALSSGESVDAPRHFRASEARLRRLQRRLSRAKRRSKRRRTAALAVERAHERVRNQRADFQHKLSRRIVNDYGLIAVEDLQVKGLARTRLAKSIHDAAWSSFTEKLAYKAESAGRQFVKVDPRGTSQRCVCGASAPKTLKDRWHSCGACGLQGPRDVISAQIIEQLGRSWQASTGSVDAVACGGSL